MRRQRQQRRIPVRVIPAAGGAAPSSAAVDYRWDADTSILTANVRASHRAATGGPSPNSESLGVGGDDGSWLVLDVANGMLRGVEVAVWPDLRRCGSLVPPAVVEDATVRLTAPAGGAAVELDAAMLAESDAGARTIHFRLGRAPAARAVRIARDVLVDIDAGGSLAGLWLLNVPPSPTPPDL